LTGRFWPGARAAGELITPALTAMLFGLFLAAPLRDLKNAFLDFKFTAVSLAVNFVWVPILGWLLGGFFLADSPALRLGYLMLLVTPCTDWYLAFTALARGNLAKSAALLPVNLLAQVALLPLYLLIFSGLTGALDLSLLARGVFLVLVLPFGLAQLLRRFWPEKSPTRRFVFRFFSGGQFFFLCLAVWAMFASQADRLSGEAGLFFKMLAPVALFFVVNFLVGRLAARLFRFSFEDSVSLSLTTLARNSPLALAVALTAWPGEPLVALPLVVGPLIELPFLAVISQLLLWLRPK
jgi:ACR3 family arsenite efflux pump ArsB